MEPSDYKLSSIAFKHRGGTTFSSGYYGTSGVIERFFISNDCAAECGKMLGDLGMADTLAATSLLHWETQVASNR